MDWIKLALIILGIVEKFIDQRREKGLLDRGQEMQIALASASILKKTEASKRIMEELNGMDDGQIDDLLRSLEPGGVRDKTKT